MARNLAWPYTLGRHRCDTAAHRSVHVRSIVLRPIGVIHTPHHQQAGTPIQSAYAGGVRGRVTVLEEYAEALADVDGCERLWLLYHLDRARSWRPRVVPYRDVVERGLFSTRSPSRPNPVGMSAVRLLSVEGNVLEVEGVDMLDGTPLLDIKPYVPEFDAHPASRAGWLDAKSPREHADGRFEAALCDEARSLNLRSWEERTPIHLRSELYQDQIETLLAGGTTLGSPVAGEIGAVEGKRVLHLQCHIGTDSLSLARMGADVTGLDFSPSAITAARELAERTGLEARFVVADAEQADAALPAERFDLVFASFGIFCWIREVKRWFRSAANLLVPGGTLYVADGHPVADVLEHDPAAPNATDWRYSYFQREPLRFAAAPSYADDGTATAVPETAEFVHPLGELVTAACQAGLRIQYLHEYPSCFFKRFPSMERVGDGWDFSGPLKGKLPLVFSLKALKLDP